MDGKNKTINDLTESEKQTLTALSQLAGGLAGGLVGNSTASAVNSAEIGKRAVENNAVNTSQSGTAEGFEKIMNTSPRKVGLAKGDEAESYLLEFSETEKLKPSKTGYFNKQKHRYVYTENGGWIDMVHFLFYAGTAYKEKLNNENVISRFIGDLGGNSLNKAISEVSLNTSVKWGYTQEFSDLFLATHSTFSYEDLPSDKFGAEFGAKYFDKSSQLSLGEQIRNYLNGSLKAIQPEKAPNYLQLPKEDNGEHSGYYNLFTTPKFIKKEVK